MATIEVSGKSLQEAKETAAKQLGVSTDRVQVTVLEETKGLFGKAQVKVRAEVVEATPVAVVETESAPEKPAKKARAPKAAKVEPEPVPTAEPAAAKGRRPARGAKTADTAPVAAEGGEEDARPAATQGDAEKLLGLLEGLLKSGDLNVTAKIGGLAGRYVNIELDGKDTAFLVGKHGEVLNALQYLVNIMGNQQFNNGIRATLDGNDYRRRREEVLESLAQKVAEQVVKRGEEAVLDALPAFERRIVHKALSEISGVQTYSEGEEPNRRVVIAPAD